MKFDFIKTKFATNILLVLATSAFGVWSIYLWYTLNWHLKFDAGNFNDVATPIAAIISIVIFSAIAWRQNQIGKSQIIRIHIETEFQYVKEILSEQINHNDNIHSGFLEAFRKLFLTTYKLRTSKEFNLDLKSIKTGNNLSSDIVLSRPYFTELDSMLIIVLPVYSEKLMYVKRLVNMIDSQNLMKEEKILFKLRVKSHLLNNFLFAYDYFSNPKRTFDILKPQLTQFGTYGKGDWCKSFVYPYK